MTFCAIVPMPLKCSALVTRSHAGSRPAVSSISRQAEAAIRQCADVAERAAKMQLESVIVSILQGAPQVSSFLHPSMLPAQRSVSVTLHAYSLLAVDIPFGKAARCCTPCHLDMRSMMRPAYATRAGCWAKVRHRHACRHHRPVGRAQSHAHGRAVSSQCGGDGGLGLCRPGCPSSPTTKPTRSRAWWIWVRAPRPSPYSLAGNSSMRAGLGSVAAM